MSICFSHTHSLGLDSARHEVDAMTADVARQLQLVRHWEGDTLRFSRSGADGCIVVHEDRVDVDVQLSGIFAPMQGFVEQQLRVALKQRLG